MRPIELILAIKTYESELVCLDKSTIFKMVQDYLNDTPLLLLGTGASIPVGIPGMPLLAEHLRNELSDRYKTNTNWERFVENLDKGLGLEQALTDVTMDENVEQDIKKCTWELVSKYDLELFEKVLNNSVNLELTKLLYQFYQAHPRYINVITTNYDRMIEYACDQASLPLDIRFNGTYIKRTSTVPPCNRNTVNLYKVHGSLDTFADTKGGVVSIPLQSKIPDGCVPSIITPGCNKYKDILLGPAHNILQEADNAFKSASSFLCIGYGFNDGQIQKNLLQEASNGKPLVVITKELSDAAFGLLCNSCSKYIVIQEGKAKDTTEFWIGKECQVVSGTFWSIGGFLEII